MNNQYDLDYILNPVPEEEAFTPKPVRNPRYKKWLDARRARRQIFRNGYYLPYMSSRPPHIKLMGVSHSGVPYCDMGWSWSIAGARRNFVRRAYLMNGYNRPRNAKKDRHRNGKKEWGADRDVWAKPYVQDKSSRVYMKQKEQWWTEAMEALKEEGFPFIRSRYGQQYTINPR